MKKFLVLALLASTIVSGAPAFAEDVTLVVYSARKDEMIIPLFDEFTKETGIKVKHLNDEAPKLVTRLEMEGENSPADVMITVDAANLALAKEKHLFATIDSPVLKKNIPAHLRDEDNRWFGLSKRVRAVFYNKDKVKMSELSTYEALAESHWKGQLLTRTSSHAYTQSLLASLIATEGEVRTSLWAKGIVNNFARAPQGGDRDQIRAIAAGEGSVAIGNSYYYARMLAEKAPEDKAVIEKIGIFFPNQKAAKGELKGAHVNISGGGVVATSKHKAEAQKLLEFLVSEKAQRIYADQNFEYPVNPSVKPSAILQSFGNFKEDTTPLSSYGKYLKQAVIIADDAGWK